MMKENWVYCRGDIYCAKLDPVVGSEQGGIRPVIVIQNDTGNKHAPTLIVATVTTRIHKKANMPTHFVIYDNPAFKEASVVQLEQIRTIDKSRIDNYLGKVTPREMVAIEKATIAVKGSALIFLLWRSTSMDRIFMDEYYEHLRADNIEAFSKERNDEYVGRAEEYKAAKSALLEGLGLEHLFDHSHELTPKEKEIWMLFDRVDVAELLARDAFAKGAYMLGAEDREIMLK